jgi:FAD:protein FMN transferase
MALAKSNRTATAPRARRSLGHRLRCGGSLVVLCISLASGPSYPAFRPQSAELTRFTYTEYHMGIDARIVVYARDQSTAEKACIAAFARIAELDTIMSDYRKDSELMRLCAKAGGPPVPVSSNLMTVLRRAEEVSKRSHGAFDVTAGPVIALWREARKSGELPKDGEIHSALSSVGWERLKLDPKAKTVKLEVPGMKLDLGGIAKGYAADEAQKALKKNGVTRALVELGGDIVVSGPPPGKKGWTIRVPNAGDDHGPVDLQFSRCAVSTSGDTEQFVVIGGVQYSHVVDPRTGQALTNRVQATVVARDGLTSDPLATTMTIVAAKDRHRILKAFGIKTCYIKSLAAK